MKKIIILLTIILIITGGSFIAIQKSSNNHKLNNALTFSDINLNKISVFEGNAGLSYDYKTGNNDAKQISDQLIQSTKIDMKDSFPNNYSQGFMVTIFLKRDIDGMTREINIIPKDVNSVFVMIKTKNQQGGSINWWGLSVESSWLSKYIDNVKRDTAAFSS